MGRRRAAVLVVLATLGAGVAVTAVAVGSPPGGGDRSPAAVARVRVPTTSPSPVSPPLASLPATPGPVTASTTSPPVRVDVPAIGVSSRLEDLGILADGSLASPAAWQVAGWFAAGVRPGDVGPAVIAGHVDSVSGPAVFSRLHELTVGDTATVTRADGSVATFAVDAVAQFPKAQFPTEAVYGSTSLPVLRLITCTGDFDRSQRSYVDNLVVTLHLTDVSGRPVSG